MVHTFLLEPGVWQGNGTLLFKGTPEKWPIFIRWEIHKGAPLLIDALLTIDISSLSTVHHYRYKIIPGEDEKKFQIRLQNEVIGNLEGKGIIDQKYIAWDFHDPKLPYEGLERYLLLENGGYRIASEFCSTDQTRLQITGEIHQKTALD
ncbi:MAG: hypothetical protein CMO81_04190 [Waddliaceae bacterium]|nr:hypothetical protein [Waddliaceae bacterium]